jgi:probable F420-dependent oxidoreductase
VHFSLWPSAARPAAEVLAAAREADSTGWDGVWVADHYMPNTSDGSPAAGETLEAWGLLPAIAATTARVRLGTLVSPTSVHHPAVLANRAATVDHVSHGRMVLGLGAGWQVNEHAAYGLDLEPPGPRVTRFEEAIRIVRSLLSEPSTTFAGSVYTLTEAPCDPKPVQDRLPILVGTRSPRMLRITARHADEWNTWGTPETAGAARRDLLRACEQVGRDPGTIRCSVNALLDLDGETPAAGRAVVSGSTQQVVDAMGAYAEAGFDEFNLPDGNLGDTLGERRERLARFRSEVIDRLR